MSTRSTLYTSLVYYKLPKDCTVNETSTRNGRVHASNFKLFVITASD